MYRRGSEYEKRNWRAWTKISFAKSCHSTQLECNPTLLVPIGSKQTPEDLSKPIPSELDRTKIQVHPTRSDPLQANMVLYKKKTLCPSSSKTWAQIFLETWGSESDFPWDSKNEFTTFSGINYWIKKWIRETHTTDAAETLASISIPKWFIRISSHL